MFASIEILFHFACLINWKLLQSISLSSTASISPHGHVLPVHWQLGAYKMRSSEGGGLNPVAVGWELRHILYRLSSQHSPPPDPLVVLHMRQHAGKELCAACSIQNTYAHQVLNGWCFVCLCEIINQFEHEQRRQWRTASAPSLLLPGVTLPSASVTVSSGRVFPSPCPWLPLDFS